MEHDIENATKDVDLGENISLIRKKKEMSIKDLAEQAGVSSSLLSQIERGLANPSIGTMKAIADVLNTPLYDFFLPRIQENTSLVSRAADRRKYSFTPGTEDDIMRQKRPEGYVCERLASQIVPELEMLRVIIPPNSSNSPHLRQHEEVEISYVQSGTAIIQIGSETETLYEGDSITIQPRMPHRWINATDEPVILILSMAKTGT